MYKIILSSIIMITVTGLVFPDLSEVFAESEKIKKKDDTMMQPDPGMKMIERDEVLESDFLPELREEFEAGELKEDPDTFELSELKDEFEAGELKEDPDTFELSELKEEFELSELKEEFELSEINEFLLDTDGQGVTCTADNGESKKCKEGCIASTNKVICIKVDEPQSSN